MNKPSFRAIVEELLITQPELAEIDDKFVEAVRKAANLKGLRSANTTKTWNLLRIKYAVRAKLAGKNKQFSRTVGNLINKARQSALEAVASYNNPMSPFRSGSFIVHMNIAWTALFLAYFFHKGIKPYYIDEDTGKPIRIDGENKCWELSKCASEYWHGDDFAAFKNIEFFIGLRNKIQHSLMPELDLEIFGECQAHLINFETIITKEFGEGYALLETLAMSLQFSRLRDGSQNKAVRTLHSDVAPDIRNYIERFRSSLSSKIFGDMEYSYKVFLLPNVGNHRSKDSLAVEFIKYDPSEAENYKQMVTLIKDRHVPVSNLHLIKPGEVAKRVASAIKPLEFKTTPHHARCWRYYKVRPQKSDPDPKNCNTKFCVYDEPHQDYVYTEEWVVFLIKEFSDPNKYEEVMNS